MTLDQLVDRAYSIAVARRQLEDSSSARAGFTLGAHLVFALFLQRERSRHAQDIADITKDVDRLKDRHPWLAAVLEVAGATEHVEVC